jgi:diguanylate cyclase
MDYPVSTILVGVAFGAVQLALGILVGRRLFAGPGAWRRANEREGPRVRELLTRVRELVGGVATNVDRHRLDLAELNAALAESDRTSAAEVVLDTVNRVVQANERLQGELSSAKAKMDRQAEQIEFYLIESRTDRLTGLPNRRAFDEELARRLADWQCRRRPLFVVLYDIDFFKKFNDRCGHLAGDEVLRSAAASLRQSMATSGLVARVGGEEFGAILQASNLREAARATEQARSAVEAITVHFERYALRVTLSAGLAVALAGDGASSLLKRSDKALYASKNAGRNRGHFHDGTSCTLLKTDIAANAEGENALRADLETLCRDLRTRLGEVLQDQAAETGYNQPSR